MRFSVAELARLVEGEVKGDGSKIIEGAAGLADAGPSDISFFAQAKYRPQLDDTKAGAVLVSPDTHASHLTLIGVRNPAYAWALVLELIDRERRPRPTGVHPSAVVSPSARLGNGVAVGPLAVIEEGVEIGEGSIIHGQVYVGAHSRVGRQCELHPQVVLRERVALGDRVIIQPGAVIGSDGYGFTFEGGRHYKIPQVGTVEIGDDVEIQANTTIDRAAVGVTRIGRGTKIDNLVQVAHNVVTGDHCLIVSQTGVAGSTRLGNYVTLAAQVGVVGHIHIGDQVTAAARSGISQDISAGQVIWGSPAQPIKDELKFQATLRRLAKKADRLGGKP